MTAKIILSWLFPYIPGTDELTHSNSNLLWLCCISYVNTLRPRQNGRHFADDIFECIFLTENIWIPIKISLKFVPKGPINNIPALVQIMAWRRPGDKPFSEPMMVSLMTHTCVTRPQWVLITIFHPSQARMIKFVHCPLAPLSVALSNTQQLIWMKWGPNKMVDIQETSFWNAFPWMHISVIRWWFLQSFFVRFWSSVVNCFLYATSLYVNL